MLIGTGISVDSKDLQYSVFKTVQIIEGIVRVS